MFFAVGESLSHVTAPAFFLKTFFSPPMHFLEHRKLPLSPLSSSFCSSKTYILTLLPFPPGGTSLRAPLFLIPQLKNLQPNNPIYPPSLFLVLILIQPHYTPSPPPSPNNPLYQITPNPLFLRTEHKPRGHWRGCNSFMAITMDEDT